MLLTKKFGRCHTQGEILHDTKRKEARGAHFIGFGGLGETKRVMEGDFFELREADTKAIYNNRDGWSMSPKLVSNWTVKKTWECGDASR